MALGPFDNFFDMDHDGKLDTFEKGMKWAFYASMAEEAANDDTDYSFRRRRRRFFRNEDKSYEYDGCGPTTFEDDSLEYNFEQPTQVSFNADGMYSSGGSKYDGSDSKTFEDDTSEDEAEPDVAPPAPVNVPKSENEKSEVQKSKNKTRNIIIITIASLLIIGLAYAIASAAIHKNHIAQIEDYCIKQAKIVSYRYNLDFEKVEMHENFGELSGSYSADYYLNGMHTLEYRQMYDLAEKLYCLYAPCGDEHVLVFLNIICSDGDEYKIYTSTRSVYLNGKEVDDDFINSKSYKEIHPEKSSTSDTGTYDGGTPYVGMYVGSLGYSGWINSGTDYDTCNVTTTKYSYKTDDVFYVIWVDINTHQAVKVLGGPSGKNVKKPTYSSSYDDDEHSAKDYSNAEDFYDDNYYDFFDYYDAEGYYYEHCD